MQIVMTTDETQIQILANWPMPHAKRVTRDNWKNPEYRVIAAIRKLRTDTNCPICFSFLTWFGHDFPTFLAMIFQQGRNSCPRLQFGFQFGLYRVVAPLSFPRSISLASLFKTISHMKIAFITNTVLRFLEY